MRLTFRAKLTAIVGTTALAFGLLTLANDVVAKRLDRQLNSIEQQYLPKLVLEPELNAAFDQLRRGFQDAVAAHDLEALAETRAQQARFLGRLAEAGAAVAPEDSASLRTALNEYDAAASSVSKRLIADETGEALVDAMASMQTKQVKVEEALKKATLFDRHALSEAFSAAARSSEEARRYTLWIIGASMVLVLAISIGLSRSLLESVKILTEGFQRFGEGRLDEPIVIADDDEWGDLAAHANDMAKGLQSSTTELKASNAELETFSYSVAHDLRAPLRGINGFSRVLIEEAGDKLDAECMDYLRRIGAGAERMGVLIDALLSLARVTRADVHRESVDMTRLADAVMNQLRIAQPERVVEFVDQANVVAHADPALVRALLDNLLGNAWKFTGATENARIAFGTEKNKGRTAYFVRDNGAGFDMAYANKLFAPFQRLHSAREFAGTGIGLATVQRIVRRHGGEIWAESAVNQGATFYFTLEGSVGGQPS